MKEEGILQEARKRFADGVAADRLNREAELEDRRFFVGEQYPREVLEERRGRPSEVFNRLPQFVKNVTGEIRQNKPSVRVLPVDDHGDKDVAEVFAAIIRHIESRSNAQSAYVRAAEDAAVGGIGWIRLTAAYRDDRSFDQELRIEKVRNPLSVVFDPDARELTKSDASWMIVSDLFPEESVIARYGKDACDSGFDADEVGEWFAREGKFVRLAEYWRRVERRKRIALMSDGATVTIPDGVKVSVGDVVTADDGSVLSVERIREARSFDVEWYLLTGSKIIDSGVWPGSRIPIIAVIGEEAVVGDRVVRHGIIRHVKGAQRAYNYFRNAAAEYAALQPKAPFLVTPRQVEGFERLWEQANRTNLPYLLFNPDPMVGGVPQRSSPPMGAASFSAEAGIASEDMKAITGIYDAALGARSNETSGVAIRARQAQGNTVTFVYIDNLVMAIRECASQLVEIIPHYWDDSSVVRLIGEDGEGGEIVRLGDNVAWRDVHAARYDVEVSVGPAFASRREEAASRLSELVQSVPGLAQIGGDIIVKAMDVPDADRLAARLRRILPPGLDDDADAERTQAAQPQADAGREMDMRRAEAEIRKAEAEAVRAELEAIGLAARVRGEGAAVPVAVDDAGETW